MFLFFIYLLVCFDFASTNLTVSMETHHVAANVFETIISSMYSKIRTLVVVSTLETSLPEFLEILQALLMKRTSSCAIVTSHVTLNLTHQSRNVHRGPWKGIYKAEQGFLLILERFSDLIRYFDIVREGFGLMPLLRNPTATTLVLVMHPATTGQAQGVLKTLWERHGLVDVAVNPVGSSMFYSYNPFQNWENGGTLNTYEASQLHSAWGRRLLDLNGYPVRVVMFHRWPTALKKNEQWVGVDGLFLTTLARTMRFTLIVVRPAQVQEYVGALEALMRGDADMALNGRFLEQQDGDVALTRPAYSDRLCAAVRRAPRLPQWTTLFRIFSLKLQIFLMVLYVLVACTWNLEHRRDAFLSTLQIFLGLSLHPIPSTWSQRILLISCFFSATVIVAAFQGQLVTVLSRTDHFPDIDTLSKLAHSGLDIATGSPTILSNTFTDDGLEAQQLRGHLRFLVREEGLLEYLEHDAYAEQLAVLTRESRALEYVARPSSRLHVVAECVRYYHLAYLMPQGSQLLPRVDLIISRLVEGGLFAKWSRSSIRITTEDIPDVKVFTLEDLLLAFLVLAVGLTVALIIFLIELSRTSNRFLKPFCIGLRNPVK